jgi:hypothetical protein
MFLSLLLQCQLFGPSEGLSVFDLILESFRLFVALLDRKVFTTLNPVPILVVYCKHLLKLLQTLLVFPLVNYADTLVFTLEINLTLFYFLLSLSLSGCDLLGDTLEFLSRFEVDLLLLLADSRAVQIVRGTVGTEDRL